MRHDTEEGRITEKQTDKTQGDNKKKKTEKHRNTEEEDIER